MKNKRSPKDCNSNDKVCQLRTDHIDLEKFWLSIDGAFVSIVQQNKCESLTQEIHIPRGQFNKLIKWYQKPQTIIKRKY